MSDYYTVILASFFCHKINTQLAISALGDSEVCSSASPVSDSLLDMWMRQVNFSKPSFPHLVNSYNRFVKRG